MVDRQCEHTELFSNYSGSQGPESTAAVLAVIWQRFGPYHMARLAGAQKVLSRSGLMIQGIEVSNCDHYEWEAVGGIKQTLFPDRVYESLSPGEIRRAVNIFLNRLSPAAVAINGWSVQEAISGLHWCRRNQVPAILMSETHESSGQWWKEAVKRFRVKHYQAAVVGGEWHADYLAALGFPRDSVGVGYDAVDNDYFSCPDQGVRGRDVTQCRYFLANTRFIDRKNIDGVLHAYAIYRELVEAGECWDLVISGSGVKGEEWRRLTLDLRLDDYVHWPGFVQYSKLPQLYAGAGAFIHIAHQEAWGLVINEAAAAGLPIIAGNRVGAVCELVHDGVNGFVVDSRDVRRTAERMVQLSGMPAEQWNEMGRQSRELVGKCSSDNFGTAMRDALCVCGVLKQ